MTAERIQVAPAPPGEKVTVDRVIKLLTTATRSDNDAERLAAYSRARSELGKLTATGVVRIPTQAQAGARPGGPRHAGPVADQD